MLKYPAPYRMFAHNAYNELHFWEVTALFTQHKIFSFLWIKLVRMNFESSTYRRSKYIRLYFWIV